MIGGVGTKGRLIATNSDFFPVAANGFGHPPFCSRSVQIFHKSFQA